MDNIKNIMSRGILAATAFKGQIKELEKATQELFGGEEVKKQALMVVSLSPAGLEAAVRLVESLTTIAKDVTVTAACCIKAMPAFTAALEAALNDTDHIPVATLVAANIAAESGTPLESVFADARAVARVEQEESVREWELKMRKELLNRIAEELHESPPKTVKTTGAAFAGWLADHLEPKDLSDLGKIYEESQEDFADFIGESFSLAAKLNTQENGASADLS